MVSLDIVPYAKASGDRASLYGVNTIGLKRNGFTKEQIEQDRQGLPDTFQAGAAAQGSHSHPGAGIAGHEEILRIIAFLDFIQQGDRQMKKLKVAVIGVGYLGRFHAQKYASMVDVDLVGVVDIDRARAEHIAHEVETAAYTSV